MGILHDEAAAAKKHPAMNVFKRLEKENRRAADINFLNEQDVG